MPLIHFCLDIFWCLYCSAQYALIGLTVTRSNGHGYWLAKMLHYSILFVIWSAEKTYCVLPLLYRCVQYRRIRFITGLM